MWSKSHVTSFLLLLAFSNNLALGEDYEDDDDICRVNTVRITAMLQSLSQNKNGACKTLESNLAKLLIANQEAILESSKKQEKTLVDGKNGILREMKNYIEKVELGFGSEVKSLDLKLDDKFAEFVVKVQCKAWKEKVSGLALTTLETGVYHFGRTQQDWKASVDFCESRGMHLATIESEKEFNLLNANQAGVSWLGASDIGHESGKFYWQDGRLVDQAWRKDGKNYGAGKETCLCLYDKKLHDHNCRTASWVYICEVSAEFLHCV